MRETKLFGILTNLREEIQKMGWNAYAEENCVTKREGKRPIMAQGAQMVIGNLKCRRAGTAR